MNLPQPEPLQPAQAPVTASVTDSTALPDGSTQLSATFTDGTNNDTYVFALQPGDDPTATLTAEAEVFKARWASPGLTTSLPSVDLVGLTVTV